MAAQNPTLIITGTFVSDRMTIAYRPMANILGAEVATLKGAGLAHTRQSVDKIERLLLGYPRPPILIGHSQGGVAALMAAQRRPDLVEGVITLGAPLLGLSTCQTWFPVPALRCMAIESRLLAELAVPPGMRVVNIFGTRDRFVDIFSAFIDGAEHHIIDASHTSMILDGPPIAFVRDILANWQPRVPKIMPLSA